jgi:serine/threonine protein kinase
MYWVKVSALLARIFRLHSFKALISHSLYTIQGAFGKVKLVKKKDSGEYFALKLQRKDLIMRRNQEDLVEKEFKLMKALSHPNIVKCHCALQDSKYLYFLMEFLPGGTLMDMLEDKGGFSDELIQFYSASVSTHQCILFFGKERCQQNFTGTIGTKRAS